jgi:hypothetical protein
MHFQILAARISFAAFLIGAVLALAAVVGVRLGAIGYPTGFKLMFPAVAAGLVAFGAGAAFCYTAFQRNEGDAKRIGLTGFFGAILLLYPPVTTQARGLVYPPISDAATDTGDPPRFVALAKVRAPGMNPLEFDSQKPIRFHGEEMTVAVALHDYYMDVTKPHAGLQTPPARAFWRCVSIVNSLGWRIVAMDEKSGLIEATDASPWFGLVSDIVIRVRPAGPIPGARVDMRSASREGEIDHGANIARLKAFFSRLKL